MIGKIPDINSIASVDVKIPDFQLHKNNKNDKIRKILEIYFFDRFYLQIFNKSLKIILILNKNDS